MLNRCKNRHRASRRNDFAAPRLRIDRVLQRKISESAGEPFDGLVSHLMDGMIEVHASDPELAALLDCEVPHRAVGAREFSLRLHEAFRKAHAPYAMSLGGAIKLDLRAFLLGNMLEVFGHSVVLRRPPAVSLRSARIEACKATVVCLKS